MGDGERGGGFGRVGGAALACAAALLAACAGDPSASGYGGPPEPARPPAPCRVSHVVDGDTIDCDPFGRVRLTGIDAPEYDQRPFGDVSTAALERLIPIGTDVLIERDVEPTDQYDRVLGYVWSNAGLVNWIMVREGYAVVLTYPPNVQYVGWLEEARRAPAGALLT
jgi:endonuclease YncB( thermonuclease family)